MSLREDLFPLVDELRGFSEELGTRPRLVYQVVRTWSGGELGAGTKTETENQLSPAPKVKSASRYAYSSGGRIEEGDIMVSKLSITYTEAYLRGEGLPAGVEIFWRVDGSSWRLVSLEEKMFEWKMVLRRLTR